MGFPITSYTVLDSIAGGQHHPHLRQLLTPYRLFAFVLANEKEHSDLIATLNLQFDLLDYETSEKFLFFAPAMPSPDWRWRRNRTASFQRFAKFQPASIGPDHEAALNRALATAMSIPESSLPCIVVTANLQARDLIWLHTAPNTIREQLRGLGYLASRYEGRALWKEISTPKDSSESSNPEGASSLETSIAETIANVISFALIPVGRADTESARDRSRRVLSQLFKSLTTQKEAVAVNEIGEPETDWWNAFEAETLKGLSYLSLLDVAPDRVLSPEAEDPILFCRMPLTPAEKPAFPEELSLAMGCEESAPSFSGGILGLLEDALDAESIYILKTALLVQDVLESGQVLQGVEIENLDYTSPVIGLAKVFEREANLSLVHWLRSKLGISLPEFFNRCQPEVQALFTPQRRNVLPVDFNKQRNGKWIPPSLWESQVSCEEFGNVSLPQRWNRSSWVRLLTTWDAIRRARNRAAHTDFVSKESAIGLRRAINELATNQSFDRMRNLKVMYRGF